MNFWILVLIVPVYLRTLRFAIELAPYDFSYHPYLLHDQIEGKDAALDVDGENWQYELGLALRKRYIEDTKLLSEPFSREEVTISTANTPKTLSALQAQLNGLYFPSHKKAEAEERGANKLNRTEETNSAAFNVSEANVNETVMIGDEVCPGVVAMVQKYRADNEKLMQGESEKHKEVYRKFAEEFNLTDADMNDTNELETEMIRALYERKGELTKKNLTESASEVYRLAWVTSFLNVTFRRRVVYKILASNFLHSAKALVASAASGVQLVPKLAIFLTNRFVLDAVLVSLKVDVVEALDPLSPLLLELYEKEGYVIEVRYGDVVKSMGLEEFNELANNNSYGLGVADDHCDSFRVKPRRERPKGEEKKVQKEIEEPKSQTVIKPDEHITGEKVNFVVEYLVLALIGVGALAVLFTLLSCCIKDTTRLKKVPARHRTQ